MFSLVYGLWEYLFKVQSLHVLIIGLDYAGKSSLLERIKSQLGPRSAHTIPMDKIPPTIGMNLAKIKYKGAQIIFWDLGGQSKMRTIWERYYNSANAVVFVVDSSDADRWAEAKREFEGILAHEAMRHAPVFILANKQDLPGARPAQEVSDKLQQAGRETAKVFAVSALSGVGIETAIGYIVNEARLYSQREH